MEDQPGTRSVADQGTIHVGKCRQPIAGLSYRWLPFLGIARPGVRTAPRTSPGHRDPFATPRSTRSMETSIPRNAIPEFTGPIRRPSSPRTPEIDRPHPTRTFAAPVSRVRPNSGKRQTSPLRTGAQNEEKRTAAHSRDIRDTAGNRRIYRRHLRRDGPDGAGGRTARRPGRTGVRGAARQRRLLDHHHLAGGRRSHQLPRLPGNRGRRRGQHPGGDHHRHDVHRPEPQPDADLLLPDHRGQRLRRIRPYRRGRVQDTTAAEYRRRRRGCRGRQRNGLLRQGCAAGRVRLVPDADRLVPAGTRLLRRVWRPVAGWSTWPTPTRAR